MNYLKGQQLISTSPSQLSTSSSTLSELLPSGAFSIIKNGEELSLRPKSPHRYKSSINHKTPNPQRQAKHIRSSTYTSSISRFIPATELVSFGSGNSSEDSESPNESNPEIFDISSEDEPMHLVAYPTMPINRSSTIKNPQRLHSISPIAKKPPKSSPINIKKASAEEIWSSYQKFNLALSHTEKLTEFKKKKFIAGDDSVYCPDCDQNVNFSVKIRNFKESL